MKINIEDIDLEIISVTIDKNPIQNYEGFGGTFVSLVDSCLRKKVLPGVYEEGVIARAELEDKNLLLSLAGGRTNDTVIDLMDKALKNTGAFPISKGTAGFFVEVRSM